MVLAHVSLGIEARERGAIGDRAGGRFDCRRIARVPKTTAGSADSLRFVRGKIDGDYIYFSARTTGKEVRIC